MDELGNQRAPSAISLSENGDATEKEWWPQLQTYISKYEVV